MTSNILNHINNHNLPPGNNIMMAARNHSDSINNEEHYINTHASYQSIPVSTSSVNASNSVAKTETAPLSIETDIKRSPINRLSTIKTSPKPLMAPHIPNTSMNGTQVYKGRQTILSEPDEIPVRVKTDIKREPQRQSPPQKQQQQQHRHRLTTEAAVTQSANILNQPLMVKSTSTLKKIEQNSPKAKRIEQTSTKQEPMPISTMRTDNKIKLESNTEPSKPQILNGIETDPDLVRNLLKESLGMPCPYLKSTIVVPTSEPPEQLLESNTDDNNDYEARGYSIASTSANDMNIKDDTEGSTKADKKKKKDKHKHKEKDKSKDRSDRKKHKKEKDRLKEAGDNLEKPVKIKISIESGNDVNEVGKFKIKIPKDVLSPNDLNALRASSASNNNQPSLKASVVTQDAQRPLRIKICKDKLENYNAGATGGQYGQQRTGYSIARPVEKPAPTILNKTNDNSNARKRKREPENESARTKVKKKGSTTSTANTTTTTTTTAVKSKPKYGTKSKQV